MDGQLTQVVLDNIKNEWINITKIPSGFRFDLAWQTILIILVAQYFLLKRALGRRPRNARPQPDEE